MLSLKYAKKNVQYEKAPNKMHVLVTIPKIISANNYWIEINVQTALW